MNMIELTNALLKLRLGGMATALEARLLQAQAERLAPIDLVSALVSDELVRRGDRLTERRIKQAGFQDLVRGASAGLAALAVDGNEEAMQTLIDLGAPTRDPARAAIALALGTVALRNTALTLKVLEAGRNRDAALELLREAFDMLEEDYVEERFFATVRRTYWASAPDSPARAVAQALIQKLEF